MVDTTVRDALRDAMAEEMRRDETVFVMGEEVAEYQGAYKVTRELLQEFGERRVIDTPITEYGFAGIGVGAVDDFLIPIGKAKVRREGNDVTLVAHSRMVGRCLEAADILAGEGIDAEVIDLRTIRPLDSDTVIESVKKTNRLVCAEEGWGQSGIGSEIAARVVAEAFDYLDAPPERVFQEDVPLPYAANLEALSLPGTEDVVAAAKKVCYV